MVEYDLTPAQTVQLATEDVTIGETFVSRSLDTFPGMKNILPATVTAIIEDMRCVTNNRINSNERPNGNEPITFTRSELPSPITCAPCKFHQEGTFTSGPRRRLKCAMLCDGE